MVGWGVGSDVNKIARGPSTLAPDPGARQSGVNQLLFKTKLAHELISCAK